MIESPWCPGCIQAIAKNCFPQLLRITNMIQFNLCFVCISRIKSIKYWDLFIFADVVDFIKSSVNIIDCIATMSFYIDLVILKASQKNIS